METFARRVRFGARPSLRFPPRQRSAGLPCLLPRARARARAFRLTVVVDCQHYPRSAMTREGRTVPARREKYNVPSPRITFHRRRVAIVLLRYYLYGRGTTVFRQRGGLALVKRPVANVRCPWRGHARARARVTWETDQRRGRGRFNAVAVNNRYLLTERRVASP